MTKYEAIFGYLQDMCGVQITEKEFQHMQSIFSKIDTDEDEVPARYLEDSIALRNALRNAGYDVGLYNAFSVWSTHSDNMAAGWLGMDYKEDGTLEEDMTIKWLNRHGELDRQFFKIAT